MSRLLVSLSIIAALWSASVLSLSVFSDAPDAHMLLRTRRANSFLEELKPASHERECVEEVCDFEEAHEIFQTREATLEFWTVYSDGNQCHTNLCVHGKCVDQFQDYACSCQPGYEGRYCDQPQTATNCSVDNGGCDHGCTESGDGLSRTCSCLSGYKLHDNAKTCQPKGPSSCGQLLVPRSSHPITVGGLMPWVVGGDVGKKGESPWQALVLNARGQFQCGAVLIHENWVLTAAHCLTKHRRFIVRLGDYERYRDEGTEVTSWIRNIFIHPDYNQTTIDNDIALMRLETPAPFSKYIVPICLPGREMAERVLHLNGTLTVVTGWGKDDEDSRHLSSLLDFIKVPLVDRDTCVSHMSHNISDNMLCAGTLGERIDLCKVDSGGPMVTLYRDTWFLVGLVSWGEGECSKEEELGVFIKVSNHNQWIQQVMDEWDATHHPPTPPSI